uniref:Zinc finger protein RFP n=1 Tax=Chrysemys picta bellii TaxID=8478 RepID=A0A8C3FQH9_CHRPI
MTSPHCSSGLLQEEVTCPICLEYLTEPVTLECGDNFCRACVTKCWQGSDIDFSCPQCRETVQQRNLKLNRQLANEPLKLFCEEDQTPICVLCDRSQAHRAHTVVLIEEAAQEYKAKMKALKITGEIRDLSTHLKLLNFSERHKIVSEFQQLRQFLEEQERLLLAQLEKLDKKVVKIQNESTTKCSEEISRLSELISEMEGKCQKPGSEFLQVRLTVAAELSDVEMNVMLDPDTAHPELLLSEGQKSVRWGDKWHRLPNNPKRFDTLECVLGCEGFTSGRYYWEVEVGGEIIWAVGVARESVRRKGLICFNPEWGIWAVEQWWGEFQALTSPKTPLPLSWVPRRIRVCLDYEQGLVTFLDADNDAPIFTFPPASFSGERIHPWLWVQSEQSQLRLCP